MERTPSLVMPNALDPFDAELRVEVVLFRSPDSDFAVVITSDADGGEVIAAGPLAALEPRMRVRIAGEWQEHPRHGLQVKAALGYELDPDDDAGARKYLLTIRGIGRSRADKLIERYGAGGLFETIDADPRGAFAALPGMGARAAERAAGSWRERRSVRELYLLLAPHGAGWLAEPLRARLGPDAVDLVRRDPYRLTEEDGVGFATADAIARGAGVEIDSPGRGRAALVHVLREAEGRGDTYLPVDELGARGVRLAGELPGGALEALEGDGTIVVDGERVSRRETFEAEQTLAERLAALAAAESVLDLPDPRSREAELSEEQLAAVVAAFERRLSVVTGGPGTGKTTLVKAIVERAGAQNIDIALAAPTGRAARRLEEATGHGATTIHRLLEWVPGEGPARSSDHPVECDLLVVDESSMLSLTVAGMLFAAVGEETHVVLIGDADQLPPVGAGKPFGDLIESGAAPVTRLQHVFRQAARSLIVQAAHAINRGEMPRTVAAEDEERDFFFIECRADAELADTVVELAGARLAAHYDVDPIRDIQVLAPIYRGAVGVDALNERLRVQLNPDGERCLDGAFRAGDKLIQTRNDYDTGLMNGQIVMSVGEDDDGDLKIESDDGRAITVPVERTAWLRPAYAISVHKSQGCEMPVVVLPVHSSHSVLLSRNLLYTAVTRARRACVLVGQPEAVRRAVRKAEAFQRHTRLAELVVTDL